MKKFSVQFLLWSTRLFFVDHLVEIPVKQNNTIILLSMLCIVISIFSDHERFWPSIHNEKLINHQITFGDQLRRCLAMAMSGRRRCGSSVTAAPVATLLRHPGTRFFIIIANSEKYKQKSSVATNSILDLWPNIRQGVWQ